MAENNAENETAENDTTENDTTVGETDIFKQQEKTAELLYDVILKQQPATTQPIYVTRVEQPAKKSPNYLLYIGIAIAVFILFKT